MAYVERVLKHILRVDSWATHNEKIKLTCIHVFIVGQVLNCQIHKIIIICIKGYKMPCNKVHTRTV